MPFTYRQRTTNLWIDLHDRSQLKSRQCVFGLSFNKTVSTRDKNWKEQKWLVRPTPYFAFAFAFVNVFFNVFAVQSLSVIVVFFSVPLQSDQCRWSSQLLILPSMATLARFFVRLHFNPKNHLCLLCWRNTCDIFPICLTICLPLF